MTSPSCGEHEEAYAQAHISQSMTASQQHKQSYYSFPPSWFLEQQLRAGPSRTQRSVDDLSPNMSLTKQPARGSLPPTVPPPPITVADAGRKDHVCRYPRCNETRPFRSHTDLSRHVETCHTIGEAYFCPWPQCSDQRHGPGMGLDECMSHLLQVHERHTSHTEEIRDGDFYDQGSYRVEGSSMVRRQGVVRKLEANESDREGKKKVCVCLYSVHCFGGCLVRPLTNHVRLLLLSNETSARRAIQHKTHDIFSGVLHN